LNPMPQQPEPRISRIARIESVWNYLGNPRN
jgi:hypothetical protein